MPLHPQLIELEGPAFERGKTYGRKADTEIKNGLRVYQDLFAKKDMGWGTVLNLAKPFEAIIEKWAPKEFEELNGIAEGAGVDIKELIVLNARSEIINLHRLSKTDANDLDDGCTAAVLLPEHTADGELLHAQNWDWLASCADNTVVLSITQENGPSILTYVEAGGLARAGMNSEGVAITGNNLVCATPNAPKAGVPLSIVRRRILAVGGYSQALTELYRLPRSVPNNMTISCSVSNDCLNFETTPGEIFWDAPCDGMSTHANHFTNAFARSKLKDEGIELGADTLFRDRRLEALLRANKGKNDFNSLTSALTDRFGFPRGILRVPVGDTNNPAAAFLSATVACVLMNPSKGRMSIRQLPYENNEFQHYILS